MSIGEGMNSITRVEHALHALVLERGAAQHRLDLGGDRARADA